MKKFLTGLVVGLSFIGGIAFASATQLWSVSGSLKGNAGINYEQTFDANNNILCYTAYYTSGSHGPSISCVKTH